MKKFAFPIITILLCLVASLLIAEAALRMVSKSVPYFNILNAYHVGDKELGWVLTPSFTARFKREDFDAVISTDEKGFRKLQSKVQPGPGATPVMFLGDSFVWGWGVSQGQVFTDVLQDELGPGFRVINRGVTKYGTVQENILLKQQMKSENPALVGLVFFYNDFSDNVDDNLLRRPFCRVENGKVVVENYPVANPVPGGVFRKLRSYSYAASFLAYFCDSVASPYYKRLLRSREDATKMSRERPAPAAADNTPSAPGQEAQSFPLPIRGEDLHPPVVIHGKIDSLSRDDLIIMEQNLREMKTTCDSHGAKFFVVYAPDACEVLSAGESAFMIAMKQICARLGIDLLIPIDAMRAAHKIGPGGEPYYFAHDLHWTPEGHRLAADVIRDYVKQALSNAQ